MNEKQKLNKRADRAASLTMIIMGVFCIALGLFLAKSTFGDLSFLYHLLWY